MKLLILLLTVIISLSAQQLSPESEAFVVNFYKKGGEQFRSGLKTGQEVQSYTQRATSSYQAFGKGKSKAPSVTSWRGSVVSGYRAEYPLNKASMTRLLAQGVKYRALHVDYDARSKMFRFLPKQKRKNRVKSYNSKKAQKDAQKILNTQLVALAGELEFETLAQETVSELPIDGSQLSVEKEEIIRYGVRFRRVHNGGIVRLNLSFVEVWFNKYGELEEIKVRWPQFSSTGHYQLKTLNEGLLELQGVLTEDLGSDIEQVANSKVEGIALSWLPVKNNYDGTTSLEPSYSYHVQLPARAQRKDGKKSRVKHYDIRARLKR
ncbi:MAG: hypothetical protein OCC49_05935 [Fibrobacterales bacterium]